jgi:hypothetical protein
VELEMARTSSSPRSYAQPGKAMLAALLLAGVLGLAGCGAFSNDNPSDSGGTITVDLRELAGTMSDGGGHSTLVAGPGSSDATTDVKSIIIGAVVITFTSDPLTADDEISGSVEDDLANDVINSINYFSIVDLPTSEDFVEFKVPPPGSGNWQVAAIGTRVPITTYQDLDDESVGIYYGFSDKFYQTSGSSGPDVEFEMKRACYIDNPPKGCAAFDGDGQAIVTAAVEIIDVRDQSGNTIGAGYPFIVRATGGTHTPAQAVDALEGLSMAGVTKVTVEVTHQRATGQSGACQAAATVADLRDECGSGTFITNF